MACDTHGRAIAHTARTLEVNQMHFACRSSQLAHSENTSALKVINAEAAAKHYRQCNLTAQQLNRAAQHVRAPCPAPAHAKRVHLIPDRREYHPEQPPQRDLRRSHLPVRRADTIRLRSLGHLQHLELVYPEHRD